MKVKNKTDLKPEEREKLKAVLTAMLKVKPMPKAKKKPRKKPE